MRRYRNRRQGPLGERSRIDTGVSLRGSSCRRPELLKTRAVGHQEGEEEHGGGNLSRDRDYDRHAITVLNEPEYAGRLRHEYPYERTDCQPDAADGEDSADGVGVAPGDAPKWCDQPGC